MIGQWPMTNGDDLQLHIIMFSSKSHQKFQLVLFYIALTHITLDRHSYSTRINLSVLKILPINQPRF